MTRVLQMVALAGLVVLGVGCPESDRIDSANGNILVELVATGGTAGRYDTANLRVRSVNLRPADPNLAVTLNDIPLGLLSAPRTMNLNSTASQTGQPRRFSPGVYEVLEVNVSQVELVTSAALPTGPTCLDMVDELSDDVTRSPQPLGQAGVLLTGFDPVPLVTLDDGGQESVRISVDVPGLVALLETKFVCKTSGICFNNRNTPAPCIDAFFVPTPDELKAVVTVE